MEDVMKNSTRTLAATFATLVFFTQAGAGNAAEIKILCTTGLREVMSDLKPAFERASGHTLALSYGNLGASMKRLKGGETVDLVILPREAIDTLVKDGKATAGNVTPLTQVGISVAVRKGAPKPDIASPEAFKRTLLSAKSITYPDQNSAVGLHIAKILERLGIAEQMKSRTSLVINTPAMSPLIADGKAEIVLGQNANLIRLGGIDIVGPLPGDLQHTIVYSGVIMNSAKDVGSVKALINFLRGSESIKVIKSQGLDPA
jgi:molybdate transport system substrate-binding protein